MKLRRSEWSDLVMWFVLVVVASWVSFAQAETCTPAQFDGLTDTASAAVYQPPRLGAPKTRVGGGTRSPELGLPAIELVAPTSTGLTHQAAPTLYWHLSDAYSGVVEYVLVKQGVSADAPLLQRQVTLDLCAGFHALNLQAQGVELEPGVTYQWSVAIVVEQTRRSKDIVAHATVERVAPGEALPEGAEQLAKQGLWYDAIDAILPSQVRSSQARADLLALLRQVGLANLAS